MSCVSYWNNCKKCKTETYDREKKRTCEECGGEITAIMEWDEAQDHPQRDRYQYDYIEDHRSL